MSDLAESVKSNKNVIQTVSGTVASIGLEQVGKKVAGAAITPATWALNYAAEGAQPGAVDIGIWLGGFFSAPASIITGVTKAFVDDDINLKLELVRAKESSRYARFIQPCYYYGMSSPSINAMTIANRGGTAWRGAEDLWVYITDAKGRLVADYSPVSYVSMYRPRKPYKKNKSGGFDWEVLRK